MRSLSNLYKQQYIIANDQDKRIINSNQRVEQRLAELTRLQAVIQPEFSQGLDQVADADGFTAGLSAPEIEYVPDQEPEELLLAREEANQILAKAQEEANELLAQANASVNQLQEQARENGRQEGYQAGLAQARTEQEAWQSRLEEQRRQLETDYQNRIAELEPQLVDVLLSVFEKVFQIQFADKKDILLYLADKTLRGVENCTYFTIRTGQDNYTYLETHIGELSAVNERISVNIIADASMEGNQCMIETDFGMYDCTIDVELQNLIKDIRSLSL